MGAGHLHAPAIGGVAVAVAAQGGGEHVEGIAAARGQLVRAVADVGQGDLYAQLAQHGLGRTGEPIAGQHHRAHRAARRPRPAAPAQLDAHLPRGPVTTLWTKLTAANGAPPRRKK
jgi:hypothetical protein